MVRCPVRRACEDAKLCEARDDRIGEKTRKWRGEESIGSGKFRRVRLQAAVGEGDPAVRGDLDERRGW